MPMKCITASIPLSAGIAREGLASPQVARRPEGWRPGAGFLLLRRCGRLCRAGPEAGAVRPMKGRPVFADIAARRLWGGEGVAQRKVDGLFFDLTNGREAGWSGHRWDTYANPYMSEP